MSLSSRVVLFRAVAETGLQGKTAAFLIPLLVPIQLALPKQKSEQLALPKQKSESARLGERAESEDRLLSSWLRLAS